MDVSRCIALSLLISCPIPPPARGLDLATGVKGKLSHYKITSKANLEHGSRYEIWSRFEKQQTAYIYALIFLPSRTFYHRPG